jgi:hypothetical protein
MENGMDLEAGRLLVERLESAAGVLERALGGLSGLPGLPGLEERQGSLNSAVERISATVEMSRREEELEARLAEAERELVELRAAASLTGSNLPKALQPLRKTLPSATAEMLSKHGIGETAVDVRALDAALVGLSLEQRIAVKSQLRRAGAMA